VFSGPKQFNIISPSGKPIKDIDAVIGAQKDLIEVLVRLTPLGVVKG
jgi:RNA-splicing ligase RtcB